MVFQGDSHIADPQSSKQSNKPINPINPNRLTPYILAFCHELSTLSSLATVVSSSSFSRRAVHGIPITSYCPAFNPFFLPSFPLSLSPLFSFFSSLTSLRSILLPFHYENVVLLERGSFGHLLYHTWERLPFSIPLLLIRSGDCGAYLIGTVAFNEFASVPRLQGSVVAVVNAAAVTGLDARRKVQSDMFRLILLKV